MDSATTHSKITRNNPRLVKPSNAGKSVGGSIRLSTCDVTIPSVYTSAIYAYEAPPATFALDIETGLKNVLEEYPVLAGRFSQDKTGHMMINITDEGVAFIEADADCTVQALMPFDPSPSLLELVPSTEGVQELLLIQMTRFACGGITIGVSWHHKIADGHAFFLFMKNWSQKVRGMPLLDAPLHDRSLLMGKPMVNLFSLPPQAEASPVEENHEQNHVDMSFLEHIEVSMDIIVQRKLHFDFNLLQRIKEKAQGEGEGAGRYTTFESLAAHLWKCITSARKLNGKTETHVLVAMDGRHRLEPALPKGYFGNATFCPSTSIAASQLTEAPLSDAAELVSNAIKRADDKYLRCSIDAMELYNQMEANHSVPVSLAPDLLVTSWVNFPLYDVDFGWGSPMYAGNLPDIYEGIVVLLPSYSQDGSIDAVVVLPEPHMELLEKLWCHV